MTTYGQRLTATKPADIAEIESLINQYNNCKHSKESEFAAGKMMLMADDILMKLKGVK